MSTLRVLSHGHTSSLLPRQFRVTASRPLPHATAHLHVLTPNCWTRGYLCPDALPQGPCPLHTSRVTSQLFPWAPAHTLLSVTLLDDITWTTHLRVALPKHDHHRRHLEHSVPLYNLRGTCSFTQWPGPPSTRPLLGCQHSWPSSGEVAFSFFPMAVGGAAAAVAALL